MSWHSLHSSRFRRWVLYLAPLTLLAYSSLWAATTAPLLSPIFGDHMVLQRGKPNPFWGWAKPGQEVHVEIAGHAAKANAAADGRWEAQITPPPEPGPYTIAVSFPGE